MGVKGLISRTRGFKKWLLKKVLPLYHSFEISEISLHSSSEMKIHLFSLNFNEVNFI